MAAYDPNAKLKEFVKSAISSKRQLATPKQSTITAPVVQQAPVVGAAPNDTSAQGAQSQMANYDKYAQQALGSSPAEAMQKAQAAAAQGAQSTSDQAVQQAIKAGKSAGAMGGQAALAATGQAANAYGQAQQAGQQQYFNTAQLGAQLGSEMSGRLQAQAQNATNQYGIKTGAETSRYGTQTGAESDRYSTALGAETSRYGTDVGAQSAKYSADANAKAAAEANKTEKRGQNIELIGQGIGALGGLAGLFSDRNLKEDIRPTKATDGLEQLKAYTYKYKKGPAYAGGREESGVMAQDLEKTGMRQAVMDTPDGKMIDTKRLSTMNTGAIAEQEKRMQRIENIIKGLSEIQKPGVKK